jgi:hypothetical protein
VSSTRTKPPGDSARGALRLDRQRRAEDWKFDRINRMDRMKRERDRATILLIL